MNFDKIKGVIGGLAPTLGAALGGPVGGAAATMIDRQSDAGSVDRVRAIRNPASIRRAVFSARSSPRNIQ